MTTQDKINSLPNLLTEDELREVNLLTRSIYAEAKSLREESSKKDKNFSRWISQIPLDMHNLASLINGKRMSQYDRGHCPDFEAIYSPDPICCYGDALQKLEQFSTPEDIEHFKRSYGNIPDEKDVERLIDLHRQFEPLLSPSLKAQIHHEEKWVSHLFGDFQSYVRIGGELRGIPWSNRPRAVSREISGHDNTLKNYFLVNRSDAYLWTPKSAVAVYFNILNESRKVGVDISNRLPLIKEISASAERLQSESGYECKEDGEVMRTLEKNLSNKTERRSK